MVMRNVTGATARTDRAALGTWPPKEELVVDGEGTPSKLGHAEDRRRRKQFVTLPAYGVAIIRLAPVPAGASLPDQSRTLEAE